jgi:hypothetical protein
MSDWGVIVKSTTGDTLISPDARTYEFVGEYTPYSRTGNISLYDIPGAETPIVFLRCGQGNAAGILAVEITATGHRVTALSTSNCSAQVFRVMADDASGYGVASYDRSGRLAFSSARNVLNVRGAGVISEGSSFSTPANTDMVSYTCGPVRPASSTTERYELVESGTVSDFVYVCRTAFECRTELVCGFVEVCGFESVFDFGLGTFVNQYVCRSEFRCDNVTTCGTFTTCGFETVFTQYYTAALIRRTTWSIDRGAAQINANTVSFTWLLHVNGYYDTVVGYTTGTSSSFSFNGPVPIGYSPPPTWFGENVFFEGQLTQNNTFPYTTSRANEIPLTCLASVRSNYD